MNHKELDLEEAVGDMLQSLEKAEDEELNRWCRPLGQMAVLVCMLRSKGILNNQEIRYWEEDSDKAADLMVEIMKLQRQMRDVDDLDEAYELSKKVLDKSVELSKLLGEDERKIAKLKANHATLQKMYEEEKARAADQDS